MTAAQEKLYWREWGAVRKAQPDADRHDLHRRALQGNGRFSHKEFTNQQFDRVLGVFRAISKPASVDAQLRQQGQDRRRVEHRLAEIQQCLGLYVEDVAGYVAKVVAEKFGVPSGGALTLDDLSWEPTLRKNWQTGKLEDSPSQVEQLLMTLWARVQPMRRDADHTLHDMRILAQVPCDCRRICKPNRPALVMIPDLEPVPAGQEIEEPF